MKFRALSFSRRLTTTLLSAMLLLAGAGLGQQLGEGAKICVGAVNMTACVPPK